MGAALMMPATLSIITNTFAPEERGKALGTWAGVSALALAIGPVVGGYLVEYVSWQSIFFLNLPVAAGAVAITLFATHESRDETILPKLDFARHRDDHRRAGRADARARRGEQLGLGVAGERRAVRGLRARAARLRLVERRVRVPMVDFDFFRSKTFLGASLVAFIVSFAMLAMFFFIAIYMQTIEGYSPLRGGHPLPPDDAHDHPHLAALGTARRQDRPAPADDRRACCSSRSPCSGSRTSRSARALASWRRASC